MEVVEVELADDFLRWDVVALALADLDHDGRDEVWSVVAPPGSSLAERSLGSPRPSQPMRLLAPTGLSVSIHRVEAPLGARMLEGDVDGNGEHDLLFLPTDGAAWLLLDDGTVRGPLDLEAPDGVLADLDGDGAAELGEVAYDAVVRFDLRADPPARTDWAPPPYLGLETAAGDIDGDGVLELVWATGRSRRVVLTNANGTREVRTRAREVRDPVVADLDGDGVVDLLVDDRRRAEVIRLEAPFRDRGRVILALDRGERDRPHALATADVDDDGCEDVVFQGFGGVTVGWGDGAGAVVGQHVFVGTGPLATGDLDGDGRAEIAVGGTGRIRVVRLRAALDTAPTAP